jgi:LacI family transcriptional regulator
VSKVLRNAYGVSEELRERVQAAVTKLGYRPRAAARAMRGSTFTIGVLLPDLHNPFFSDILDGVNAALARTQYQTMIGISHLHTIEMPLIDTMIDWKMDGIILIGHRLTSKEAKDIARRVPLAAIAHHEPTATTFDTVNNDDKHGAEIVVDHLVGIGKRRIAFLSLMVPDPEKVVVTAQREQGFLAAMKRHGLPSHARIVRADQSSREIQTVVRHLLESGDRPDALFCWSDFVAFEALSVVHDLGLSMPRDLAVVGYDNTSFCDLTQNSLTSVDQSGQILGLQAARLVVERIKGRDKAEHFVVPPRLVIRRSSASTGGSRD